MSRSIPRSGSHRRPITSKTPPSSRSHSSSNKRAFTPNRQLLIGLHPVKEALKNPYRKNPILHYTDSKSSQDPAITRWIAKHQTQGLAHQYTSSDFNALVKKKTGLTDAVHQGLFLEVDFLEMRSLTEFLTEQSQSHYRILALDELTDPHNVGALIRTASAFGFSALLWTKRHRPTLSATLGKSAAGGLEHLPLIEESNLSQSLAKLAEDQALIVGLSEAGTQTIHELDFQSEKKVVVVMGAEGKGLRRLTQERCTALAQIKTNPAFPCLNVSNAFAVAAYEVSRQINIR